MTSDEKRSVFAGLYGNALEWYDFLLYANFAPVFARYFFPMEVPFLSLLATFAVFALGFLVRPLGGILLGLYADRLGRRQALVISVCTMTASTLAIALLPGFNTMGIMAPLLFVGLRMIQGIAVGAELPGSTTFLVEHMSEKHRGFAGSLILTTAFIGTLTGALVASLLSHAFSASFMLSMGWRIAYLFGALLGLIGIYLRLKSIDPAIYSHNRTDKASPIRSLLSTHRQELLFATFLTSILAIGNYLLIAWLTTFLVETRKFPLSEALSINVIGMLTLTLLIPFMGWLSDKLGRRPVFLAGALGLAVLIFPLFWLLLEKNWWHILFAAMVFAALLAPLNATVPTMLAEMFPTAMRATGVAAGYNLGQALFGGTLPMVAFALVEYTGNVYAPAFYVLAFAAIALLVICMHRETAHASLPA